MRHKIEILATIALLTALTGQCLAQAQDLLNDSAYQYYSQCRSVAIEQSNNRGTVTDVGCTLYSVGLFDGLDFANQIVHRRTGRYLYAEPDQASYGQKMLIVIKYLENNPKELNNGTTAVAINALTKAYPPKDAR